MIPNDLNKMFQGHSAPSSPHPRDYIKRPMHRKQGATIGDGIRSSAKIAAVTTVITLLIKSGPALIIGLGGLLICLWSYMAPQPRIDSRRVTATAGEEPSSRPSPIQVLNSPTPIAEAPRPAARRSHRSSVPATPGQTVFEELDQQPLLVQEDNFPEMIREPRNIRPVPGMVFEFGNPSFGSNAGVRIEPIPYGAASPLGMGPLPNLSIGGIMGMEAGVLPGLAPMPFPQGGGSMTNPNDFVDPARRMMEQTLAEGNADSNTEFVFKRGRKFIGTSQMPGEPSSEIRLSIVSVKDRGSNVTARLSKLTGTKFTRNYNGLIETDPLRLVLIPEAQTNGFSAFVTYSPWYSNSPTKITLSINPDKGLSGTSISGEIFELEPEGSQVSQSDSRPAFEGFGPDSASSTEWIIREKNGRAVIGEVWQFESESRTFIWKRNGVAISQGSFNEIRSENGLDLVITSATTSRKFECRFQPASNTSASVHVCVPKSSGVERPPEVDPSVGNVFRLERSTGGR